MAQTAQGQFKKLEDQAKPFLDEAKEQGEAAIEAVRDFGGEASTKAKELADDLVTELKDVPKLIKKYPVQSVLIGFGAGLLSAWLLRRAQD